MYSEDFGKTPKDSVQFVMKYVKNLGNEEEIMNGI
jgi:hypothetical protein